MGNAHRPPSWSQLRADVKALNRLSVSLRNHRLGAASLPNVSVRLLMKHTVSEDLLPFIWMFNDNVKFQMVFVKSQEPDKIGKRFISVNEFYKIFGLLTNYRVSINALEQEESSSIARLSLSREELLDKEVEEECVICMESGHLILTNCCGTAICKPCAKDWFVDKSKNCPTCDSMHNTLSNYPAAFDHLTNVVNHSSDQSLEIVMHQAQLKAILESMLDGNVEEET